MSPLIAAPNRGYADWQRIENWDTGTLWQDTIAVTNQPITSPVLDVSRTAYLGGYIDITTGDVLLSITWYDDMNLDNALGSRTLCLSSLLNASAQLRVPNLGPYAQITLSSLSAAVYAGTARVWGTNRSHPLELIPQNPVQIAHTGTALAASDTNIYYPVDYYAGPMSVNSFCGQTYEVQFEYLSLLDQWGVFNLISNAASAIPNETVIAPPGAWRVKVINQTATATTESLRIVTSTTGSS